MIKISHKEFLWALASARVSDEVVPRLEQERWIWESFAFDDSGARYEVERPFATHEDASIRVYRPDELLIQLGGRKRKARVLWQKKKA